MSTLPSALAVIDIESIDPRALQRIPCFGLSVIDPISCDLIFKKAYYIRLDDITGDTENDLLDSFYRLAHSETRLWLQNENQTNLRELWLKSIQEGTTLENAMTDFLKDIKELRKKFNLTFASDFNSFDLAGINASLDFTHKFPPLHTPVQITTDDTGNQVERLGYRPHVDTDSWKLGLGLSDDDPCEVWASDRKAFELLFDPSELRLENDQIVEVINPANQKWVQIPNHDHHPENDAHYIGVVHCLLVHARSRFSLVRNDGWFYQAHTVAQNTFQWVREHLPGWISTRIPF